MKRSLNFVRDEGGSPDGPCAKTIQTQTSFCSEWLVEQKSSRDRGVIAEPVVSKVLRETMNQVVSRWTDVLRRTERIRDAVHAVASSACKGVSNMIRTMMDVCEDGDVGEIGASTAAWA